MNSGNIVSFLLQFDFNMDAGFGKTPSSVASNSAMIRFSFSLSSSDTFASFTEWELNACSTNSAFLLHFPSQDVCSGRQKRSTFSMTIRRIFAFTRAFCWKETLFFSLCLHGPKFLCNYWFILLLFSVLLCQRWRFLTDVYRELKTAFVM